MSRPRRSDLVPAGLIVAAVLAAYANALGGPFQFDDWNVIVRDTRVQSLAAWWAGMPGIRPLLKLSYAANHALGLGVPGFHAVNLAIHVANALLVRWLLTHLAARETDDRHAARLVGVAGALLFALHPVQTEAVTYVSGRSTSLAACCALCSIAAWVVGRQERRPGLVFAASPALFAAAIGVKETAVVLPLALLLIEATDRRGRHALRATLAGVAAHGAVLLAAASAVLASPTYRRLLMTSLETRDPWDNLRTQAGAVFYLAGQLVRFDRLNIDPLLSPETAWTWVLVLQAAVLGALLVAALAGLRRRPGFALATLWFFLWLAPTNSFVARLDVANDRQLYLALLGPVGLFAAWLGRRTAARRVAVAAVLLLAVGLGAATVRRNMDYGSQIALWEDTARKSPHNARAFNNLGFAYALACRLDDARAAWLIAQDLDPGDFHPWVNQRLLREKALPGTEACAEMSPPVEATGGR